MKVVTVSRQYGTGGRLFGKKLAEELGFTFVDKIIAHELAQKTDMSEGYIEHFLDTGIPVGMSSSDGEAFSYSYSETQKNVNLQIESHRLLKKLADEKDIVVVGRASDIILSDYNPFRIFIYGDDTSRIMNIKEQEPEGANLSAKDIQREMVMIDNERYQHHALFSHIRWGEKLGYDLCINATNVDIQKVIPMVAGYVKVSLGIE